MPLMKRLRYFTETLIVYFFYHFFMLMPYKYASHLGGLLAKTVARLLPLNKVAWKNLSIAFPDKTYLERQNIVEGMWENLGRVAAEYPHLKNIWQYTEIEGEEYIEEAKKSKQGAIFISAHIANWEVVSQSAQKNGLDINVVYRKPNNQGVEKLLQKARSHGSIDVIAKGSAGARKMVSILKAGGVLGVMMDQKLNEGMAVPFFGKDAMTAVSVAKFALRFDCPIYPAQIVRNADGVGFKVKIHPKLEIIKTGDDEKDTYKILCDINRHIEKWVRENPEQWLWIHRRWAKEEYL